MNKQKRVVQNNLKKYRLKAGLSQKQVAKLIGVNNAERVCHWEKGNNIPVMANLKKLCSLYSTRLEDLYT
jgi:DNA-binding XRE family transcriptional regulator